MIQDALNYISFASNTPESVRLLKPFLAVLLLALFWCWETWWPFIGHTQGRWKHAGRNLAIAVFNTVVLSLLFGALTLAVNAWTQQNQYGLLNQIDLSRTVRFTLALLFLDLWMYLWHRANHVLPLLWRFHRMHHSDRQMDVTTATRFQLGEHVVGSSLRLALIPLVGLEIENIVIYDVLLIASTQFHHADIGLGRFDHWLRFLIVTPQMHKVHHSDWRPETNSNYATVLSVWDRIAGTFRMRADLKSLVFGLPEFKDPKWQSWWGMWKTPLANERDADKQELDESSN